ncbi:MULTISPECIES: glycosyltransferase [Pseudomonas]|uniref:Glycosyltransferase involved in cell wall bisynthesis n=1 Tax=Pseudomonas lutea TaxID=243924 RepID=A0A9X8QIC6_9PSED|nr:MULTISPECIES: glycosyltransferase [Pseudomonas]SEQ00570.1 Glycosyltransferase involved in cell wall bisynthesis [Pseudomonas lutea]
MTRSAEPRVLQFCHGYDGPFLDCARQYASLFKGTGYRVTTVFLTGAADAEVATQCASDEVLFMEYSSKDIRGLKLGAIRALREIVRSRGIRFIIAHRFKPIWIACLATKLPVIGVHHAFGDYDRLGRRLFANAMSKRLSLLAVSNAVRDEIRQRLTKWPVGRIETLYNRINVEGLQAQQLNRFIAREQLRLAQDAWVIGNVGRLHPDKDQATLLEGFALALPKLPAGSLLAIIGKGGLEASLKDKARELGIADRVLFLGQIPDAKVYYKAFDVFALTSDHEPFGMVLLEAMAAGIPLISTGCGGAREVVEGAGVLFPLRDVNALAEGLVHLSKLSPSQIVACADASNRILLKKFSDDVVRYDFWNLEQVRPYKDSF